MTANDCAHERARLVGRPISRETLRGTTDGVLVTCHATNCEWQALCDSDAGAAAAIGQHYDRLGSEQSEFKSVSHLGTETYTIVRLLDAATAETVDESKPALVPPSSRLQRHDGTVREVEFPRTTGDVPGLVERGDKIQTTHDQQKIVRVTESRSHGLPTWSVAYCDIDADPENGHTSFRYANELIARDGQVYYSYGEDPLRNPAFEVVGAVDHQSGLGAFAGDEA